MAHDFPQPTCPRCGYDLRGTVATWDDAGCCPLDGTCTECGLRYEWADLFAPDRKPPAWFCEYCPRAEYFRACVGTFTRSLVPWRFWKRVRMEHHVQWRRLAAYVAVAFLLPALLLYVGLQTTLAVYVRYQTDQSHAQLLMSWQQLVARHRVQLEVGSDPERIASLQESIEVLDRYIETPHAVDFSYAAAVAEAVFTPLRYESQGRITGAVFGSAPYASPRNLLNMTAWYMGQMIAPGAFVSPWVRNRSPTDALMALAAGAVVLLLVPMSMALLPISRRRARVRWEHVARVACYSVALPMAFVLAVLLLLGSAIAAPQWAGRTVAWAMLLAQFGMPIATFLWWWAAIGLYFRMRRGWLVSLALTALSSLLIIVAVYLVNDEFIVRALM